MATRRPHRASLAAGQRRGYPRRRVAARGGDAVLLIDGLEYLPGGAARVTAEVADWANTLPEGLLTLIPSLAPVAA